MNKKEWFEGWFHTPYYRLLYAHRDTQEAEQFVQHLYQRLALPSHARILDLPCGNGRHTQALCKRGFFVTGLDINPSLIEEAKQYATKDTCFEVHDMRKVYKYSAFELVCNLFTSLGYFSSEEENVRAIQSMALALTQKGVLVIDFLNAQKVRRAFVPQEEKIVKNTHFRIQRHIQDPWIIKDIYVTASHRSTLHFQERVMLLELHDFLQYFRKTGLKLSKYIWKLHL